MPSRSTSPLAARIAAISAVAKAWQAPDYPPRAEAVAATRAAPNRFTEEALAFAINHQMHQLASPKKLRTWLGEVGGADSPEDVETSSRATVGIIARGAVPLDGLRAVVAVWLAGHVPVILLPEASPALLRAFAASVAETAESEGAVHLTTTFASDLAHVLGHIDALVAEGGAEDIASWASDAEAHGIAPERRLLRTVGLTVAIVDGTENFEERIGLAEDVLLHEGLGAANVLLLWAPERLDPDPYLEAFSGFRQVMPAHPDTEGVLEMPRAFLKAADLPYAWGDGVLVSRGEPDPQTEGHLRWSEYGSPDVVTSWIEAHRAHVRGVVATPRLADRLGIRETLRIAPGNVHRRPLGGIEDQALAAFVAQF